MGLQAQMKTSLPWPSSMLTLLAGISSGPASAIAVSPPLACGLLQPGSAGQCPALSAVPLPASRPVFWWLGQHKTCLELDDDPAGSTLQDEPTASCTSLCTLCRHVNFPPYSTLQCILQSKHPRVHLLWGWLRCLSATSSFFACTLRFRSSTGFVMISRAESMVYSPSMPDASCSHPCCCCQTSGMWFQ